MSVRTFFSQINWSTVFMCFATSGVGSALVAGWSAERLAYQQQQWHEEARKKEQVYARAAVLTELRFRIGRFKALVLQLKSEIEARYAQGPKDAPDLAKRFMTALEELDHPSSPITEEFKDKRLLDLLGRYESLDPGIALGSLRDEGDGILRVMLHLRKKQDLAALKDLIVYPASTLEHGEIGKLVQPFRVDWTHALGGSRPSPPS